MTTLRCLEYDARRNIQALHASLHANASLFINHVNGSPLFWTLFTNMTRSRDEQFRGKLRQELIDCAIDDYVDNVKTLINRLVFMLFHS